MVKNIEKIERKYGPGIEDEDKKIFKVYDDDDFFSFVFYDTESDLWYSDDSVGSIPTPADSFEEAVINAMNWLELVHNAVAFENQTQSKRAIKKRMLKSLADWMAVNGRIRKPFREKFNQILNLNG